MKIRELSGPAAPKPRSSAPVPPAEASTEERPPYVQQRRNGLWFWEPSAKLRAVHGVRGVPLGPDRASAWAKARALNARIAGSNSNEPLPGTIAALFKCFLSAAEAGELKRNLRTKTLRDYRHLANVLSNVDLDGSVTLGRVSALALQPVHADRIWARLKNERGHRTANYAAALARRVWNWGARQGMVEANPWEKMELPGLPGRTVIWSPEQITMFIDKAEALGWWSLALAVRLAYAFGHRQGDWLDLTWAELDGTHLATNKTGAVLPLPLDRHPALLAALNREALWQDRVQAAVEAGAPRPVRAAPAASNTMAEAEPASGARLHRRGRNARKPRYRRTGGRPAGDLVLVHDGTGGAWNEHAFRSTFRAVCREAGLPDELQFRDIRATVATEFADAGATPIQMSTHGGWRSLQMQRRYARFTLEQAEAAADLRAVHLAKRNTSGSAKGRRGRKRFLAAEEEDGNTGLSRE